MNLREKIRSFAGLWWISWFGIWGGFLFVGGSEYKRELAQGGAASHFSVTLLTVVTLSWITFFIADAKLRAGERAVVNLLTVMGTLLAIFTLLGIVFFISIAPRIH
jgi:hypothetical protein